MPALERAGIIGVHWHDLRHTFASRLVMEGVPLKTVANYLGHASTQMVEVATTLEGDDGDLRENQAKPPIPGASSYRARRDSNPRPTA
jgi:integrase